VFKYVAGGVFVEVQLHTPESFRVKHEVTLLHG
jgi:hypothetical protein